MDPFVFALVLAFMVCKSPVEDLAFAVRGKESPRLRHRRVVGPSPTSKLGHAATDRLAHLIAPKPPKPHPARQYWRDLWEDAWNTATIKRRDKRDPEPVSPVGVVPEGETAPDGKPTPPTGGGSGRSTSPPDAEPVNQFAAGAIPPPPAANFHRRPPVVHADAERTDKLATDTDAATRVDNTGHTVIDAEIVDTTTPVPVPLPLTVTGGSTMTDTQDTGTMNAAIAYAERMLGSVAESITALDVTASGLERDDWSGDAVDGLREAIGHFGGVQSQLEAARDSLHGARPVQDAYTAAPHVGSRESVLAE